MLNYLLCSSHPGDLLTSLLAIPSSTEDDLLLQDILDTAEESVHVRRILRHIFLNRPDRSK